MDGTGGVSNRGEQPEWVEKETHATQKEQGTVPQVSVLGDEEMPPADAKGDGDSDSDGGDGPWSVCFLSVPGWEKVAGGT